MVPLGTNYLASYASGVRVGLKELCPKLIGQDPTQIKVINNFMDFHLKGHPYVKSPIDMACWDILGKVRLHFDFIAPKNWVRGNRKILKWLKMIKKILILETWKRKV